MDAATPNSRQEKQSSRKTCLQEYLTHRGPDLSSMCFRERRPLWSFCVRYTAAVTGIPGRKSMFASFHVPPPLHSRKRVAHVLIADESGNKYLTAADFIRIQNILHHWRPPSQCISIGEKGCFGPLVSLKVFGQISGIRSSPLPLECAFLTCCTFAHPTTS